MKNKPIAGRSYYRAILLVCFTLLLKQNFASISGPSSIKLGKSGTYSWSPPQNSPGATFTSWSINSVGYWSLASANLYNSSNGILILDEWAISQADVELYANFNSNGTAYYEHITVQAAPRIIDFVTTLPIPAGFFLLPNQAIALEMKDPSTRSNCNVYYWTTTDNIHCAGCNGSGGSVIAMNSNLPFSSNLHNTGEVTIDCILQCPDPITPLSFSDLVKIKVKLATPSSITGLNSVGCGGSITSGLVYSVPPVPFANHYSWTIPSGWTTTGPINTHAITLNSNGQSGGLIQVQAFAQSGSAIKTDLVSLNVVCCITSTNITGNATTGNVDNQETANSITASNDIGIGATARYHAGIDVNLIPGFHASKGSTFHGYIEGCTGSFYRVASSEENTTLLNPDSLSSALALVDTNGDVSSKFKNTSSAYVFPNPNSGKFKVVFTESVKAKLIVYNELGFEEFNSYVTNSNETELLLEHLPKGLYFLRFTETELSIKPVKIIIQ